MKKVQRILSLILAIAMLVGMMPSVFVSATDDLTGYVSEHLSLTDSQIIDIINNHYFYDTTTNKPIALQPVPIYQNTFETKNNKVKIKVTDITGKTADFRINGTVFTNYFYYGAVAEDENVDFYDAASYAQYLVTIYRIAYDEKYEEVFDATTSNASEAETAATEAALQAFKEKWDLYLLDLYDPEYAWMNDTDYYTHGTSDSMGDKYYEWPKSGNKYSSFHYADTDTEKIKELSYDYLENGVDYSKFVSDLTKTATAAEPGDENTERKYDITITADAQAKISAPVVMILQIQTAWQLFDLEHANKLKTNPKENDYESTEVGAVANNTELATLYEIKHALLDFVDYMEEAYPGNNLFLGVTETKHDQSTTMFHEGQLVSNNADILKAGLLSWDIFGNCEHVHYDSEALEAVVNSLENDLTGLRDYGGTPIPYDDISKTVVIIGGPTENTEGTNGYACLLPWQTFKDNEFDAVYGIRVNDGTSYVTSGGNAGVLSWLDFVPNNYGEKYSSSWTVPTVPNNIKKNYKIEGDNKDWGNFTDTCVATTREQVYNALIDIVEDQLNAKGINVNSPLAYIEDLTVSDTIAREFVLDPDNDITATWIDKNNNHVCDIVIDPDDAEHVVYNSDGTITVSYTFDSDNRHVLCGDKAILNIPIVAQEDFIGSNNVLTNIDTPTATYTHTPINKPTQTYEVECNDTPEVNVPVVFEADDGGNTVIWKDDTVDLADLKSEDIIADVMDRIDNYAQTNGTVTFEWVLPDEVTVVPIDGSIVVENGTYDPDNLPDLSYEYLFDEVGDYAAYLRVIFTPNEVMDNGNFGDDTDTAVPVGPHDDEGRVDITVLEEDNTRDFYVRKVWNDSEDHTADQVEYQLLAEGEPYLDNDVPVTGILNESNNWQVKIEGLPEAAEINGVAKTLEYSVIEEDVKTGYKDTYDITSQTDQVWNAYLKLTLNPSADVAANKAKFVHVEFTYNGDLYNYDYPITLTKKLENNTNNEIVLNLTSNTPKTYSGDEDQYGTDGSIYLPINSDGTPVGSLVVNDCYLYSKRDYITKKVQGVDVWEKTEYTDKYPGDNKTLTYSGAIEPELVSSETVPVLVIINTPYFQVVHHNSDEKTDDVTDEIPLTALDTDGKFDITNQNNPDSLKDYYDGLREGTIYGGMYTTNEYTTPSTTNGLKLEPKAGDVFYLREVPDYYLRPKTLFVYDDGGKGETKDFHTNTYLVTALDAEGVDKNFYRGYGFEMGDSTNGLNINDLLKGTAPTVLDDETSDIEENAYYLYNTLTVTYKTKEDSVYYVNTTFPEAIGYFGCVGISLERCAVAYRFIPYFITADNVLVTGVQYRDIDALDATKDRPALVTTPTAWTATEHKETSVEEPVMLLSARSFLMTPPPVKEVVAEPETAKVTVKVIDSGNAQMIEIEAGDLHEVLPTEKEGYRFAGWYQDQEFKVPADLNNVQEDITVYARYISDSYFAANCEILGKQSNPTSVHVSCMADSDAYTEFGFEVTANGKTEKVVGTVEKKPEQKAKVLGSTKRIENKKNDMNNDIKITADVSVKKYAAGTEIEIKPYYVTADGTVCYGSSQTILRQKNGIKF